jgi:hypothetical protein
MSVGRIRVRYSDRFDIDAQSLAVLDGATVDDDTIVRAGQVLTFVRHSGEKGLPGNLALEFGGDGLLTDEEMLIAHQLLGAGIHRPVERNESEGEMPTVTIRGECVSVTSPEGQTMTLSLDELLVQLGDRRMNTGEVLLPDGVKWVTSRGRMTIWVHQTPPRVHHLKWIAKDSPGKYGRGTKYRELSLALPYLIVFAAFSPHRGGGLLIGNANECFFRNEPLRSLDDELFYPALLNCSKFDPPEGMPLSWICSQHLDRSKAAKYSDENDRMRQGFRDLMHCVLESGFNYSSEEHEASSWYSESRGVDPRISTVERWARASKKEPLFVLDVPWLPVGMSVRQVADRIAANNGAGRRRVRTSQDAARVLYNNGSAEKPAKR